MTARAFRGQTDFAVANGSACTCLRVTRPSNGGCERAGQGGQELSQAEEGFPELATERQTLSVASLKEMHRANKSVEVCVSLAFFLAFYV
jgi:hypothetical protein